MDKITGIDYPRNRAPHCFRAINRSFDVTNQSDRAVVSIYEDIGPFGITAADFRRELDAVASKKQIELRINSPGGDVFDGIAIYNDLLDHPAKINVKITSLAASAASVIAMAGDKIEMSDNAFMMIHNAWALAIGDKQTMHETADMLNMIDGSLLGVYGKRTGIEDKQIAKWMDNESWFSADEAKEHGFIDDVAGEEKAKALFDLSVYNNVPVQLKRQIEAGLRDAGYSKKEAKAALHDGFQQRDAVSGHRDDANHDRANQLIERISALKT